MSRRVVYTAPLSPRRGRLEFTDARFQRTDFTCTATIESDGEEWSIGLDMIEPYRADMMAFFEELATDPVGWSSPKEWESEFAELSVRATRGGENGIVTLDVLMRWPPRYDDEQRATLVVRAVGLAQLAEAMRAFLRIEGRRFTR